MNEIKFIDPVKDRDLFIEAWGWQDSAPRWFQDSQSGYDETLDDFISADQPTVMHIGIFIDESITAMIRLTETQPLVFNLDLFAKRKTNGEVLAQAALSAKEYLFSKGVRGYFGWIPSRNKPIVQLYKWLGFVHRGVECLRGETHGRTIKWLLMEAENI